MRLKLFFTALALLMVTDVITAKAPHPAKIERKLYRIKIDRAKIYAEANKQALLILEAPIGYIFEESGLAVDEKYDRSVWVFLSAGYIEKISVEPRPADLDRYEISMASQTCSYDNKAKIVCRGIKKKAKKTIEFNVSQIKTFLNSTSTCNDPQRTFSIESKLSEVDSNRKGPTMADYTFYTKKGTLTVVQFEQNHSPWECH